MAKTCSQYYFLVPFVVPKYNEFKRFHKIAVEEKAERAQRKR